MALAVTNDNDAQGAQAQNWHKAETTKNAFKFKYLCELGRMKELLKKSKFVLQFARKAIMVSKMKWAG